MQTVFEIVLIILLVVFVIWGLERLSDWMD
jgi:flagellar biogenesis protein FliO